MISSRTIRSDSTFYLRRYFHYSKLPGGRKARGKIVVSIASVGRYRRVWSRMIDRGVEKPRTLCSPDKRGGLQRTREISRVGEFLFRQNPFEASENRKEFRVRVSFPRRYYSFKIENFIFGSGLNYTPTSPPTGKIIWLINGTLFASKTQLI